MLDDAKRSNSVVSTGDSSNSRGSQPLLLRGLDGDKRRVGSGIVLNSRIGTGLSRVKGSIGASALIQ